MCSFYRGNSTYESLHGTKVKVFYELSDMQQRLLMLFTGHCYELYACVQKTGSA